MEEPQPLNFSYKIFEPAEGSDESLSPVIFLHGALCSKEIWDDMPQIIADKSKRKTFAYDARNHGSSVFSNAFSFDLNVDDLFSFMDSVKIPKAVVIGHSMGGFTASRAALKKPERIEMMFSEDMLLRKLPNELVDQIHNFTKLLIDAVNKVPTSMSNEEATKCVFDQLFSQTDTLFAEEKEGLSKMKFVYKRKPDGSFDVAFNKDAILRAMENYAISTLEAHGVYSGPAYFIYGDQSYMKVGAEKENIKQHFPEAEFIEFAGATHNVHTEFEEKFVSTILNRMMGKN